MHPLLSGRRGLLYAGAWLPVAGMLVVYLRLGAGSGWGEAVALAGPLTGVFALLALSAYPVCRMTPLGKVHGVRVAATVGLAAVLVGGVWTAMVRNWAAILAGSWTGVEERVARVEAVLWVMAVLLYLLAISGSYVWAEWEGAERARTEELRALALAREAELKALRDQISPHFLFNSLNSISALVGVDKGKAREMCALLADFFRKSLAVGERRMIPLGEEVALARHYLAIEQVRFGDRLQIEEKMSAEAEAVMVPPLLLQPLLENAVKHGVAQLVEGGWIRIEAEVGEQGLRIRVRNTRDEEARKGRGTGVGLTNVRKRLEAVYGSGARMMAEGRGGEFVVEIGIWRKG